LVNHSSLKIGAFMLRLFLFYVSLASFVNISQAAIIRFDRDLQAVISNVNKIKLLQYRTKIASNDLRERSESIEAIRKIFSTGEGFREALAIAQEVFTSPQSSFETKRASIDILLNVVEQIDQYKLVNDREYVLDTVFDIVKLMAINSISSRDNYFLCSKILSVLINKGYSDQKVMDLINVFKEQLAKIKKALDAMEGLIITNPKTRDWKVVRVGDHPNIFREKTFRFTTEPDEREFFNEKINHLQIVSMAIANILANLAKKGMQLENVFDMLHLLVRIARDDSDSWEVLKRGFLEVINNLLEQNYKISEVYSLAQPFVKDLEDVSALSFFTLLVERGLAFEKVNAIIQKFSSRRYLIVPYMHFLITVVEQSAKNSVLMSSVNEILKIMRDKSFVRGVSDAENALIEGERVIWVKNFDAWSHCWIALFKNLREPAIDQALKTMKEWINDENLLVQDGAMWLAYAIAMHTLHINSVLDVLQQATQRDNRLAAALWVELLVHDKVSIEYMYDFINTLSEQNETKKTLQNWQEGQIPTQVGFFMLPEKRSMSQQI
jgi:hypothetical protein